jgi:hypothetical protein
MRAACGLLGLLLTLGAGAPAQACGHCVEDKVAAVYDHAVEKAARTAHHHVAYFAIEGTLVNTVAVKRSIEAVLTTQDGIDKASVRVSMELAALSFSFDPRRAALATAQAAIERKLAPQKLGLTMLKVVDGGAPAKLARRE